MRLATLAGLCLATAVAAQTPDPTPPAAYYPLQVGNVWEYEQCRWRVGHSCSNVGIVRQTIVRDTTIADTLYAVEVSEPVHGTPVVAPLRLLRFDAASATVRARDEAGREHSITCRLDAAFYSTIPCNYREPSEDSTAYVRPVDQGQGKSYEMGNGWFDTFEQGVGLTAWGGFWYVTEAYDYLRYAFVDGQVVYGQPFVAVDAPAANRTLALAAGPNPTDGPLALSLTLAAPSAVTVEAFDALGRRVHRAATTLGAGAQTMDVNARGWAPGVYVVRVAAGGASATGRVVRR